VSNNDDTRVIWLEFEKIISLLQCHDDKNKHETLARNSHPCERRARLGHAKPANNDHDHPHEAKHNRSCGQLQPFK
jgi:hypothetical protein